MKPLDTPSPAAVARFLKGLGTRPCSGARPWEGGPDMCTNDTLKASDIMTRDVVCLNEDLGLRSWQMTIR